MTPSATASSPTGGRATRARARCGLTGGDSSLYGYGGNNTMNAAEQSGVDPTLKGDLKHSGPVSNAKLGIKGTVQVWINASVTEGPPKKDDPLGIAIVYDDDGTNA